MKINDLNKGRFVVQNTKSKESNPRILNPTALKAKESFKSAFGCLPECGGCDVNDFGCDCDDDFRS